MSSVKERVEKGAEILDEVQPGWEHEIDENSLDMGYCGTCILGQLYGTFGRGVTSDDIKGRIGMLDRPADFGFDIIRGQEHYKKLGQERYTKLGNCWKKEIIKRKSSNKITQHNGYTNQNESSRCKSYCRL